MRGLLLLVDDTALQNGTSGNDAHKNTPIIHNGDKVLILKLGKDLKNRLGGLDGRVPARAYQRGDLILLQGLIGAILLLHQIPEKIPLRDRTDVNAVLIDHGDGGIAAVMHFFQPVAKGSGILQAGHKALGDQETHNVHKNTPLMILSYTKYMNSI
jgi:hypothetical protein